MLYPQDIISEVKALNDIVDVVAGYGVKLTARADKHFGLCPFHSEKTPSFSVSRDKQMFYCFGCGAGGNVISFVRRAENMDFIESLKLLADRVHFNLPEKGTSPNQKIKAQEREICSKLNKQAAHFYYKFLHENNEDAVFARKYLENRGVNPALLKRFGLGLSPSTWNGVLSNLPDARPEDLVTAGLVKKSEKNISRYYDRFRGRLMFPIIDHRNRVVGFGGRVLGESDEAKYINTPETALFHKSDCLYGLNLAKKAHKGELIIVEGYMDVLTMHLHGFANTVGVLGTAMRDSHARLLKSVGCNSVILIFDSDAAGIKAALRAIPILVNSGIKTKILEIPEAKDPDEYLSRFGAKNFTKLLNEAKTHIAFQLDLKKSQSTEGSRGYAQEAVEIIKLIPSEIEKEIYINKVADETGFSASAIRADVEKAVEKSGLKSGFLLAPRTYIPRIKNEDIGLKNAKKGLIRLVLTYPNAAKALKQSGFITSEEMGGGIFAGLLTLAFENSFNSPADIVDFFESDEEQQTIAEIFADDKVYTSNAAVEKALNDMTKKIKDTWLHSQIEEVKSDMNAVNSLLMQIKSINSLNITISAG
ncbi:MAG: DNA primase [Defluviitaleaceae bacterium]|nr:DNA primase [Defluviitaleaceae bacterium]